MIAPNDDNRELESEIWLDRLERLANQKASASQNVSDLEKAASAAALIASARKSREELKHHSYRLQLGDAQSWAFLAIPFLILVGLLVFLPRPNQQAQALRETNDDQQFREVEKTFLAQVTQTGALARPDLLLLTTPLQPYIKDPRYSREAGDLLILALAHAATPDAFQDYFVSRNIHVDAGDLTAILTLDRMLYTNFNELDDALNSDATSNASTIVGHPLSKEQVQRVRDGILLELTFLSGKVASYLRSRDGEPLNADLRRVYFKGIDLGGVVFGKSNLEGCQWEGVSLNNADLSSVAEFDNSQWIDADWWNARVISKPLLSYLAANQYPYHPPVVDYSNAPSSREVYEEKVTKLCRAVNLNCDAASMPYGTPTKTEKHPKPPLLPVG
jgi:hypothetical protein